MNRRTPLRRTKAIRKKRPTPRRGEPTAEEKHEKRQYIYDLSGGRCELNLPGCNKRVLPFEGDVFTRWHLVHMRARRRFGWPTDGRHRMVGGCYNCHIVMMHNKGMKPDLEEA